MLPNAGEKSFISLFTAGGSSSSLPRPHQLLCRRGQPSSSSPAEPAGEVRVAAAPQLPPLRLRGAVSLPSPTCKEAPQLRLSPRRQMRSSLQAVSQHLAPQGLAAGISDPPWQRGGCGRGRALTCRLDGEGWLREAKPCFEEETWVCFALQGNQTGFSIQAARSLPSPPALLCIPRILRPCCCGGTAGSSPLLSPTEFLPSQARHHQSCPGRGSPRSEGERAPRCKPLPLGELLLAVVPGEHQGLVL